MIGTITIGKKGGVKPSAPLPVVEFTMVGDADYATGGSAGVEAALQAKVGQGVTILGVVDQTCDATWKLEWNATTGKLAAFGRATGLEVAAHVDLHGVTFNLVAICR
jgi:bifunctional ADP-heptose synthase (sugar kinase/adenylyltransferase)